MPPIGRCPVCGLELFLNMIGGTIPNHAPSSRVVGKKICSGSGKPPKYLSTDEGYVNA